MQLTTLWVICFAASKTYAQISSEFSAKLLVQADAQSTKSNVIVSPYSLVGLLGTLSLASVYSTRREILDVLGVENKYQVLGAYQEYTDKLSQLEHTEIISANKIYINEDAQINHKFNTVTKNLFDTEVDNIDFKDKEVTNTEIRDWLVGKTKGNIIKWGLKSDDTYQAAIVNAVYLNANWATQFTLGGFMKFHVNENKSNYVRSMNLFTTAHHTYTEDLHAEVFQIHYKDDQCSFVGVVPYVRNTVDSIVSALSSDGNIINKILEEQMSYKQLNLTMPGFDVLSTTDLKLLLQNLGVEKLFEKAQLYHLLKEEKDLKVNDAHQKVVISVNPQGTLAGVSNDADETSFRSSMILSEVDVLVEKPFYFEVRCSDIVLINGIIRNPMLQNKH